MERDWYVRSQTQQRARKPNSSQMASAGVAHLAYRCSFSQEALNWIGNQPENVDLEKVPWKGTKLMWLQNNECVLHRFV